MESVSFNKVKLRGFWKKRFEINTEKTIPMVYSRFKDTGRFEAFKCNWKEGMPNKPHIFWDSDVAKLLEAAAYTISICPDKELEKMVDDTVDLIEQNQWEDGYFNIYYTVCEPGNRFTKRDNHELYCAGHLTEAAVAYYEATGKDKFLRIMCKYMDFIEKSFITEKTAKFSTPGHEEIELALIKLYECTGNEKYLEMCRHFIEKRGRCEDDLNCRDWCDSSYDQSDVPVRELPHVFGHSVRATYLLCGMADLARHTDDKSLFDACDRLFENIANKRMYITGGIGSCAFGESFVEDYILPNDIAYSETCASIGLAFFAKRMSQICPDAKYDDVAELAIYNCDLAGVSLDGGSFFYVNPLEINIDRHRIRTQYYKYNEGLLTQRIEVFGCSCCPPNIARFIPSIGNFLYTYDDKTVYVHHYMDSETTFSGVTVDQKTEYPNDGKIVLTVSGMNGKNLAVRIPGWCKEALINGKPNTYPVSKGYAYIPVDSDSQSIEIEFKMVCRLVSANPCVEADLGKVCICRGPIVYCAESILNNDVKLNNISIDETIDPEFEFDKNVNGYAITVNAYEDLPSENLYSDYTPDSFKKTRIKFLPYYAFANNGESDMLIWFRHK